jgi:hypothetical protein
VLVFDLRGLKIEFAKVESARKEVERVATALAELAIFLAAFQRRFGSDETQAIEVRWLAQKVGRLLDGIGAPVSERQRVFRYLDAVKRIDAIRETDKAAADAVWADTWRQIASETASPPKPEA